MKFPSLGEIAVTSFEALPSSATYAEALRAMLMGDHRHLIISCADRYCVLGVHDILRFSREATHQETLLETLPMTPMPMLHKDANILEALDFLKYDTELLAITEGEHQLFGIVAHSDIISSIDPDILMENYRLCDFVKVNKSNRWIHPEEPTSSVLADMERYNHDAAIIITEQRPIGILTTKDILRLLQQNADLSAPIKTYMTTPVQSVHFESTISAALHFMRDKHFKRIVTVDHDGKLAGVITQKELISITYSRWVMMMKKHQQELHEINSLLEKRNREMEKIASTDPLTGLYNRMKFIELYVSEYTVMTQRSNAMSLLMIDIDYFKKINDTFRHNTGDQALRAIAQTLSHHLRHVDIICRWGGEEFVALLPTAEAPRALIIAEQIRDAVATHKIQEVPAMTVSIGVTQIREGDTLDEAVNRADAALYDAKNSGRNRVCIR